MGPIAWWPVLGILLLTPAAAAAPWTDAPPDDVTVHLVTALPGHQIGSAWYGHTGLLVEGPQETTFYAYRLDIEDSPLRAATTAFTDVGFSMHAFTWQSRIDDYIDQGRGLHRVEMRLSGTEKAALFAGLERELDRANATYAYQILHDNCSTRLRDLIDEALGGRLHAASQASVGRSFRDYGPEFIEHAPVQATLMYAWLGHPVDDTLTQWDTMAFPEYLEAGVVGLGITEPAIVVLDTPAPEGGPGHVTFMAMLVSVGLLVAAPMVVIAARAMARDRARRALGTALLAGGLLFLPFAIMNALSWTGLLSLPWQDSYALLLTGPFLGWPLLGALELRARARRFVRGWMHAELVLALTAVVVHILGLQDPFTPLALTLPLHVAAIVAVEVTGGAVRAGSARRRPTGGAPGPHGR